jgi:spermidine/putrescine transport system substrate-binding protein
MTQLDRPTTEVCTVSDDFSLLTEHRYDRKGFLAAAALGTALLAGGGRVARAFAATDAQQFYYYNWADYVNPKTYGAFTKATGIQVKKDFYVSNEELQAKLQAGARGYDLIVPTGYEIEILKSLKLLQPLDWSKLPNAKRNLDSKFKNLPYDKQGQYSVPKDWGTTGFVYRTDKVKEKPTSWKQFFDLTMGKYSGKVTLLDGMQEVIGSIAIMMGYSYNTENQRELDAVKAYMIKLKPHLRALTSTEYRQQLIAGKTVMALGWNGDGAAVAAKVPARYVVPREGAEVWIDAYAIPVGAKSSAAAHAWINYCYAPAHNAVETAYTYYGSPLKRNLLQGVLDKKILADPTVFPPLSVFQKLQVLNASPKALQLRNRIWTEFKAA